MEINLNKFLVCGNIYLGNTAKCVLDYLIQNDRIVESFNFSKYFKITRFKLLNKFFSSLIEKKINKDLIQILNRFKPDVLFVIKGLNIFPETLTYAKSNGVVLVNWNLDDFENSLNNSTHMRKSYGLYDYVFTNKFELISLYEKLGMKNVSFIENYYIKDIHKPINDLPSKKSISFVGSWSKKREKLLLATDIEINVFGSGWKTRVLDSKKLRLNNALNQSDYVNVINESYINLNFLTEENNDTVNLRFFEVCATNSLLICEYSDRFNAYLNKDSEMTYFQTSIHNDLRNKIDHILNLSDQSYIDLKEKAFKRIISQNHSFSDRMNEIMKIIGITYNTKKIAR